MMLCPKCGQEVAEQEALCPVCGCPLTEEVPEEVAVEPVLVPETDTAPETDLETDQATADAAEDTEASEPGETDTDTDTDPDASEPEAAETDAGAEEPDAPVEDAEAAPEAPQKKKSPLAIVAAAIIVLLVIIVVCLSIALKHVNDGGSLPSLSSISSAIKEKSYKSDAIAVTVTDEDGNTISEFTNSQLSFYYWGEYYYYVNNYGFSFDASLPLDEQTYQEETDSATGETTVTTWQDYFLENARYSINQTQSLKAQAEAEGFTMPEDYQSEYDSVIENLDTNAASAGFTDEDGNGDVLAYVQDSYGDNVTLEDFEAYLYDSYLASAYSDSIYQSFTYEDSDLDSYYQDNADYFLLYGIEQSDIPNVNVRHILIEPEADEDGEISDEAWEAAAEEAQRILEEWQSGDATEESFGTLAETYSTDGGSNTNGGLYEDVYPGEMVDTFNDWCFDESRQVGDTGIVETSYGYHIMYFVSYTDEYYWKTVVENELRYNDYNDYTLALMDRYTTVLTDKADVQDPSAVKQIQESAATDTNTDAG
jgi:RNA polymerase subunit RPABC4/transcription elongation factor Spt4